MSFTVLVCGGRRYADKEKLARVLSDIHAERRITLLALGGAPGADTMARHWAEMRSIPYREWRAEWQSEGLRAGPIRNAKMLHESHADLVVAFPGNVGTAHMVKIARAASVEVREVR